MLVWVVVRPVRLLANTHVQEGDLFTIDDMVYVVLKNLTRTIIFVQQSVTCKSNNEQMMLFPVIVVQTSRTQLKTQLSREWYCPKP